MITILGPTASGKTKLAVAVAARLDGEIISADSRQVYRGMDIGTGKDLEDYEIEQKPDSALCTKGHSALTTTLHIPHHLIDICDAGEKYNLFRYQQDFRKAYADIEARGKTPILCGGTGLYIEAVLKEYNLRQVPEDKELRASLEGKSLSELTEILTRLKEKNGSVMHNVTDVDTPKRAIRAIEIELANANTLQQNGSIQDGEHFKASFGNKSGLIFGTDISREDRRRRITERLDQRLNQGMIAEAKRLLDSGITPDDLIYYGLEYKYLTLYLTGKLSFHEMRSQLEIAIHQFAKRQMTWFRGMEKRGLHIHWIDFHLPMDEKTDIVIKALQRHQRP